jgi:hypothetical protein
MTFASGEPSFACSSLRAGTSLFDAIKLARLQALGCGESDWKSSFFAQLIRKQYFSISLIVSRVVD